MSGPPSHPRTFPHVPQLDGIRALAVSIVFIAHAGLERIVPGGFGVTIFFFLSGYLITSQLRSEFETTNCISFKNFYLRRLFRIVPPLYIVLGLSWLLVTLGWLTPKHGLDVWAIIPQALFFANYAIFTGHTEGVPITGIWSLAVEEHFYLVFPFLYAVFLSKVAPRNASIFCLGLCILVLFLRFITANAFGPAYNYYFTHTRVDSILFGSCLALWRNPVLDEDGYKPSIRTAFIAVAIILLTLLIRNEMFRETWRYSLQGISLYVLFSFLFQDHGLLARIFSSAPAKLIGLYSYTIYLVHIPIMMLLEQHIPANLLSRDILAAMATMLFASTMYTLVERPLAKVRRKLHREKGSAADPLAAEPEFIHENPPSNLEPERKPG